LKIFNVTKNKLISENAKEPKSPLAQAVGLIGAKKAEALILKTRFGIHTFGLRFPIDVLILNKERELVDLRENLKPARIFVWKPHYNTVIELPNDSIKKSDTALGDKITISPEVS
jgi:uncharacterized protein